MPVSTRAMLRKPSETSLTTVITQATVQTSAVTQGTTPLTSTSNTPELAIKPAVAPQPTAAPPSKQTIQSLAPESIKFVPPSKSVPKTKAQKTTAAKRTRKTNALTGTTTAPASRPTLKRPAADDTNDRAGPSSKRQAISLPSEPDRPVPASPHLTSHGLPNNTGVNCYRNSILQALLHVLALLQWVNVAHSAHPRGHAGCLFCEFRSFVARYHDDTPQSSSVNVAYSRLMNVIDRVARRLHKGADYANRRQADAHEFLLFLIEELEKLSAPGLFRFKTIASWTCGHCGVVSKTPGSSEGLTVNITDPRPGLSLSKYIEHGFKQVIHGMRCDACGRENKSALVRRTAIESGPEVLYVQISRFQGSIDHRGNWVSHKLKNVVPFAEELDLSAHLVRPGSLRYRLNSVVHHSGSLGGGHYVATARDSKGAVQYNDSHVKATRNLTVGVDGFTPYILMYSRE